MNKELAATVEIRKSYAWSDSQVALACLRAASHPLEVFVANWVAQMQNLDVPVNWRHVPGELNQADCASRGCTAPELRHHFWWGPEWLSGPEFSWPSAPEQASVEELPVLRVHLLNVEPVLDHDWLLRHYSL